MVTPSNNEAPIIYDPSTARATSEELAPLSAALAVTSETPWATGPVIYTRGTVRPGGVIDLCKQGLGADGVEQILGNATQHPGIHHVLLGTNALGAEGVQSLADALQSDHGIETLYLGCNGIDGGAIRPLTQHLTADQTVTALWLKRNPLDDDGAAHVAEAVRLNRSLRTLDIVATGLSADGLARLRDALAENANAPLEHLYLGANDLTAGDIELVGDLVANAPNLVSLSVSGNPIGNDGLAALTQSLAPLARPLKLMLSDCSLTSTSADGVAKIGTWASALSFDQQPYWIGRKGTRGNQNALGDSTAVAIANTIAAGECSLETLDLSGNGLSSRAAMAVADAVEHGDHRLQQVRLGKGIAKSARRRIKAALPETPSPYPVELERIRSRYR